MDQRLVIMAREKEPTRILIFKAIEQRVGEFDCPGEVLRAE